MPANVKSSRLVSKISTLHFNFNIMIRKKDVYSRLPCGYSHVIALISQQQCTRLGSPGVSGVSTSIGTHKSLPQWNPSSFLDWQTGNGFHCNHRPDHAGLKSCKMGNFRPPSKLIRNTKSNIKFITRLTGKISHSLQLENVCNQAVWEWW